MNIRMILLSILIILIFISFVIGGYIIDCYNGYIHLRNSSDTQLAQVDSSYQRRFDLIPNLVNTTKGYLQHEQKVFADIAEARTRYSGAVGEDKIKAQGGIDSALARLLVIMENYPNLKADTNVIALTDELAGTENRINIERMRYNETIRNYNNHIQRFPNNLIASHFGFKEKILFKIEEKVRVAPIVNLEVKQ